MKRYRALARVIGIDVMVNALGEREPGCFVVFPSWCSRVAVRVPWFPLDFPDLPGDQTLGGQLPFCSYAMICLETDNWEDLKPEWCL